MREPPYRTELKPYGRALVDLARRRCEVLCLSGDLTRQTEVDLFQAEFPDRFIHGGMAEANMMSMAGALARCGYVPFVHTFGVFATRRPYDQIANAIAYPGLPVRIIGFMPGVSTPGGPSHQATDDVALMRALPDMTVVDVADAVQTRQVVQAIADVPCSPPRWPRRRPWASTACPYRSSTCQPSSRWTRPPCGRRPAERGSWSPQRTTRSSAAWARLWPIAEAGLGRSGPAPAVPVAAARGGEYSPL